MKKILITPTLTLLITSAFAESFNKISYNSFITDCTIKERKEVLEQTECPDGHIVNSSVRTYRTETCDGVTRLTNISDWNANPRRLCD